MSEARDDQLPVSVRSWVFDNLFGRWTDIAAQFLKTVCNLLDICSVPVVNAGGPVSPWSTSSDRNAMPRRAWGWAASNQNRSSPQSDARKHRPIRPKKESFSQSFTHADRRAILAM